MRKTKKERKTYRQTDRQSQRERESWIEQILVTGSFRRKNEGIYLFSILPSMAVMSCGQSDEDEDEDEDEEEDELQNKTETET